MNLSRTNSSRYTISEELAIAERVKQKIGTTDLREPYAFLNMRTDAHIEFYLERLESALGK